MNRCRAVGNPSLQGPSQKRAPTLDLVRPQRSLNQQLDLALIKQVQNAGRSLLHTGHRFGLDTGATHELCSLAGCQDAKAKADQPPSQLRDAGTRRELGLRIVKCRRPTYSIRRRSWLRSVIRMILTNGPAQALALRTDKRVMGFEPTTFTLAR